MVAPLKVGLAGLGTVGASVVRLIERQREALEARCGRPIEVVAVTARSRGKRRDIDISGFRWAADAVALAGDREIDVFVEVIGGENDPAKRAVEAALSAGKSVVTANKALLARHGVALAALAEQHHVALNFEAAVAGGIPIVKTLREGLVGNSLKRIYGILNGTCNYILTRMERENLAFAQALEEAQRLGYAEANPSFDIEGHDTAQKLAILASLAFGTRVDPGAVYVEGIASITPEDLRAADDLGYRVKLLGVAVKTENGIEQRVHPTMVPKGSAIAQVMGVTNAVTVDADAVREITLVGPGAGVEKAPMQRHEGGYYIRMLAVDKPGTAARIATCFAEESISLESIMQRHFGPRPLGGEDPSAARPVPVILITYATTEDAVRRALAKVEAERVIEGKPQLIRIEKT